jgi:hypothetical protein
MSNYIKIPMADGAELLTGDLVAASGGVPVTGATATSVAVVGGGGSGAIASVTVGGRALVSASDSNWSGTGTQNGTNVGVTGTGGSGTGSDPTFNVSVGVGPGFAMTITMQTGGSNIILGDTITIAADTTGGDARYSAQTLTVVEADMATGTYADLVIAITSGGDGYEVGTGTATLEVPTGVPAGGANWGTDVVCNVTGLVYDDGLEILLPIDNVMSISPTAAGTTAVIAYADQDSGGTASIATLTLEGGSGSNYEATGIALSDAIAKADQAENSQPSVVFPSGVTCVEVAYS